MNPTLKIGLITISVGARRAVPLPLRFCLCAFGLTEIVGCNKRSALHHNVRRNARWLLRPTATVYKCIPIIVSAIALLAIPASSGAEPLGRLFFTPEQRAQMEYSRLPDSGSGGSSRALTVNGIVQQHGGRRTAWINGVPRQAGDSDELAPESLPIVVPGQSKPVKVKVGQKILIKPSADRGQ
ncbi:MAG: hypothetical protein A2V79_04565 [Betaproteobacteria bacterium RBG_16_56_24]|nr:MAG: hypothetical protein A2V79_04565 [Betaproteobacteria bacterium RBG_16_56_24]